MTEKYHLEVPAKEYYQVEFRAEFIEKEGFEWIKLTVLADGRKILAEHDWRRNKR